MSVKLQWSGCHCVKAFARVSTDFGPCTSSSRLFMAFIASSGLSLSKTRRMRLSNAVSMICVEGGQFASPFQQHHYTTLWRQHCKFMPMTP